MQVLITHDVGGSPRSRNHDIRVDNFVMSLMIFLVERCIHQKMEFVR